MAGVQGGLLWSVLVPPSCLLEHNRYRDPENRGTRVTALGTPGRRPPKPEAGGTLPCHGPSSRPGEASAVDRSPSLQCCWFCLAPGSGYCVLGALLALGCLRG